MEDLTIEDLIADVISNPTPVRVPCETPPPPVVPPALASRRGLFRVIRGIVRRVSGRLRR